MTEWTISLGDKTIRRFNIKEGWQLTIGRGTDADVIVDNTAISRKHTSIELKDGSYLISDLGSLNGTFVNGKRIEETVSITEKDNVKLGKFKLTVSQDDTLDEAESASYGAHPDTDDMTVIVRAKDLAQMATKSTIKESNKQLVLIEGNITPNKLSLKGKNSIKIGKGPSSDMLLSGLFIGEAQCYIVKEEGK